MARLLSSIAVILVSLALMVGGNSLLGTLLAVRMTIEGFDSQYIGPVLAFHSLGFVIGTLYGARLIRRVGHIRSFAAFAAVACVAALMHPLWVDGVAWAVLRAVTGFAVACLMMVMESWINDRTANNMRGSMMAFYMGTSYLAQGSGQFALALGDPETTTLFIIAGALVAASLVPLALTRSKAPVLVEHELMGIRKLFRLAPLGIVGAMMAGTASAAFMAVAPVYAHIAGYTVQEISVFMGVAVLVGMAMQWPVGHLSDRLSRRAVIVTLALLGTLVCVPLAEYGADNYLALLVFGGLFMGLVGSLYPICVALTNDLLDPHQIVSASGTLLLTLGIGTIIGPVVGSAALQWIGSSGLFMLTGAALTILTVFGFLRLATARAPVEHTHYQPAASAFTPVIMEMDPNNPDFRPQVVVPEVERRQGPRDDRRQRPGSGGRRRSDATDIDE